MEIIKQPTQIPVDQDELIDVVDEHDTIIGTVMRSQKDSVAGYYRSVLAFIVSPSGKLCFLRRTASKAYPLEWALVGGGVQSGESYDVAFAREIAEEASIDVSKHQTRFLGLVKPSEFPSKYFKAVYEIRIDTEHVNYTPTDFCESCWLLPNETNASTLDKSIHDLFYLVNRFYGAAQ